MSLVIMICLILIIPLRSAGVERSTKMAQVTAMNSGLQLSVELNRNSAPFYVI